MPLSPADDLPQFIRQHIRSVWALEILLLVRRSPEQAWSVDMIAKELRASAGLVAPNLERFARAGLVVPEGDEGHRFAPASPHMAELCTNLDAAYRERPVTIINLISAPEDRLQQLADAFRFKDHRR